MQLYFPISGNITVREQSFTLSIARSGIQERIYTHASIVHRAQMHFLTRCKLAWCLRAADKYDIITGICFFARQHMLESRNTEIYLLTFTWIVACKKSRKVFRLLCRTTTTTRTTAGQRLHYIAAYCAESGSAISFNSNTLAFTQSTPAFTVVAVLLHGLCRVSGQTGRGVRVCEFGACE